MKAQGTIWAGTLLMSLLHVGLAGAQQGDRPSLLVAPWRGPAAPNMAAEISVQVRKALDSLALFDRVEWNALVDSSPATRDMSESRRAELNCLNARQLAGSEGIEYVLCGGVLLTPEGFLLELRLFEISGGTVQLGSIVAEDVEALVERALSQLREWEARSDGSESSVAAARVAGGEGEPASQVTSCTTSPSTTVRTTRMSLIVSGSTSCGSSASITKSASLPVEIEPFCASSKDAYAPWIVPMRRASSTVMRCSGPQTRPS